MDLHLMGSLAIFWDMVDKFYTLSERDELEYKYGLVEVFSACRTFYFTAAEWLYFVNVLNDPCYWHLRPLYQKLLLHQVSAGLLKGDEVWESSRFTRLCLELWMKSPPLNIPEPQKDLKSLNVLPFKVPHKAKIPAVRRGIYFRCPYCDTHQKCHFSKCIKTKCAYSETTKVRCLPMAGLHQCNGHGSRTLLNRGKGAALRREFTTNNGRKFTNLKKLANDENFFDEDKKSFGDYWFGQIPLKFTKSLITSYLIDKGIDPNLTTERYALCNHKNRLRTHSFKKSFDKMFVETVLLSEFKDQILNTYRHLELTPLICNILDLFHIPNEWHLREQFTMDPILE